MFKNVTQERISKLLSDISTRLLSTEDVDNVIIQVIEEVGQLLNFDRVYLCKNLIDKESGRTFLVTRKEWVRPPYLSIMNTDKAKIVPYDRFPRWYNVLSKGRIFSGNVNSFPDDERSAIAFLSIKTLACVPIIFSNVFWGFVGFNNCSEERELTQADEDTLSAISMMFASYVIRKKIADDLKYNEQRLYKALEGSGEGVWDLDCQSSTFYLSDKAKELVASDELYRKERVPMQFMMDIIINEDRWIALKFLEKLAQTDNPVAADPFRVLISGRYHWFALKGSVIGRDLLNNPLRIVGTVTDVTEKLEMEHRLKEALLAAESANKAKSQFLAVMSHEIRTPLNGMIGFLRLLVEHVQNGTGQEYLRIINNSTGTLLNIINSILDISKVESGNMELEVRDCNLTDELEAISRLFSASAFEKRVFLHTFIDSAIPATIQCDQQRLRQVLSNLLNNALKFTSASGFIYLEAVVENKTSDKVAIKFSIKDTGIGIGEAYLQNIFKPFTQADSSVSRKYGGSGLGLTIACKFVELMGGELKIQSKVGEGSDFYFTLSFPLVEDSHELICGSGRKLAFIEYPKSAFEFERNLKAMGCDTFGFDSFDDLLCADLSDFCALVFSTFYTNQGILNDIQTIKNKYPDLRILLITYPVDVSIFDVLNSLKIKTKIRPFSVRKLYNTLVSMQSNDISNDDEKEEETSVSFVGKVLVAEDNAVNCKLISILLGKYGIETSVVTNGREALDKMKEDVFDLVLMDVNMPVMDGMTATREIRRIESLEGKKQIPVIALTANVLKEDAKEFLAAGMDQILTKPIIPKELEEVFHKYLQHNL